MNFWRCLSMPRWPRGGPAGPLCRKGGDLVIHALRRPEPVPLGAPQPAPAWIGSPDSDAVPYRGAEACRDWIAYEFPHRLFALVTSQWWLQALVYLSAPINVGIALKVWNALRIEMKLEEQKRLLLEARLDALQRQINPHFLFNTLNSIASLVRMKPELAREMIVKLANILRALLKEHDSYVPLSEELQVYRRLSGHRSRPFRRRHAESGKGDRPADAGGSSASILLQPLIENSIKHGLEPRINGGTVTLRSRLEGDRVRIEVADDGVGMGNQPASALRRSGSGIGMKNVQERLDVLYGNERGSAWSAILDAARRSRLRFRRICGDEIVEAESPPLQCARRCTAPAVCSKHVRFTVLASGSKGNATVVTGGGRGFW